MGAQLPEFPNLTLLRPLGKGGGGSVYLAEQVHPHRQVAVKIVSPQTVPLQFLQVLKEEGNIAAKFDHDNLVAIYECGIVDDHYYQVMPYLPGGDLGDRLRQGLSPADAVDLVRQIASALCHIHRRGFVHLDIKPGNVLFSAKDRPVLVDFGIAKSAETVGMLTKAGYSSGTPAYMSPEQVQGQTVDGRSDLYSLGVMFYELLTGQRPFFAVSDFEMRKLQVECPAPRLPEALAQFQRILDSLTAKDPEDRYADDEALIQALDQLTDVSEEITQVAPDSARAHTPEIAAPESAQADPDGEATWLRRPKWRRVLAVMALYLIAAWIVTEAFNRASQTQQFGPWSITAMLIAFVAGLAVALGLSWLFDAGPHGTPRLKPSSLGGLLAIVGSVALFLITPWLMLGVVDKHARLDSPHRPETVAGQTAKGHQKDALLGGLGILRVNSAPTGARVLLDGIEVGETPLELWTVASGQYRLQLEHEFTDQHTETIEIADNVITSRDIEIPTAYGALTVLTRPEGAWIEIDGVRAENLTPAMLEDVQAGIRHLRAGRDGYASVEREVRVSPASRVREELSLDPLPVSTIRFDVSPQDAELNLVSGDGQRLRYTADLRLPAGRYRVEASAPGYAQWNEIIDVGAGDAIHEINLKKLTTRLFVDTRPAGARVTLLTLPDQGYAPGLEIPRGEHRVRIELPGYESAERTFQAGEESLRLDITLAKTPPSAEVEPVLLPDASLAEPVDPLDAALAIFRERRFDEAFIGLLPFAEAGQALAQTRIGDLYAAGLGTNQDDSVAAQWYLKAATQNEAEAQAKLGTIYENGLGVQSDVFQSYVWYTLAARHGDSDAMAQRDRVRERLQPAEIEQAMRYIEARFPQQ